MAPLPFSRVFALPIVPVGSIPNPQTGWFLGSAAEPLAVCDGGLGRHGERHGRGERNVQAGVLVQVEVLLYVAGTGSLFQLPTIADGSW